MNKGHFIKSVSIKQEVLSFKNFNLSKLKRVNIFIGENSSGKSNIIRAIIGFPNKCQPIEITFNNGKKINLPLDNHKEEHPFFEIPPFRNLIIQEDYPVCGNERSGMVDIKKINKHKKEFYRKLQKIIGINIELKEGQLKGFPCCLINSKGCIELMPLTTCGNYRYTKNSGSNINIDLLGWGTKSVIIIFYNLFFAKKHIVFVEEPEISTHPNLLKKLFDWAFKEKKDCQFFITTHSSLLLDKIFLGFDEKEK